MRDAACWALISPRGYFAPSRAPARAPRPISVVDSTGPTGLESVFTAITAAATNPSAAPTATAAPPVR